LGLEEKERDMLLYEINKMIKIMFKEGINSEGEKYIGI
jgi:hypothetical protein